jgi:hypothetical protein
MKKKMPKAKKGEKNSNSIVQTIAKQLNCSDTYVRKIISGDRKTKSELAQKISDTYNKVKSILDGNNAEVVITIEAIVQKLQLTLDSCAQENCLRECLEKPDKNHDLYSQEVIDNILMPALMRGANDLSRIVEDKLEHHCISCSSKAQSTAEHKPQIRVDVKSLIAEVDIKTQ